MTPRKRTKKCSKWFCLLSYFLIIGIVSLTFSSVSVNANEETTTLRIISTGDLHGQLTTTNYDNAAEHTGSLAQVHTLIKEAREEIQIGNTVTVDLGDTIYGYGADYAISVNGPDYMYQAMREVGYDAMLLGNHDFDYGYEFIKDQLEQAGLTDLCVVSNVYDVQTEKTAWNENKLITKEFQTSEGRTVSVKIGIAGVTVPALSSTFSLTGVLTATDMKESMETQVKKLKDSGADVIIALVHGNMGTEEYTPNTDQAVYAIANIEGVDAVMFGHPHINFPSKDKDAYLYYEFSGIDEKNGLMNGIPVISLKDHAIGIGIADLTLSVSPLGEVSVSKSKGSISYVEKTTPSSPEILQYESLYDAGIKETYKEIVGAVEENTSITNYFGLLSDNKALQLSNEAKIQYGLSYIQNNKPEYADYPVIASTSYNRYGKESFADFIKITGNITVADILSIQSYNHEHTSIYYITGAQLRKWLEYCASAYEKVGTSKRWTDANINEYTLDDLSPVLMPEWTENWSNFSIFDGIEYTIDVSKPARYDIYANTLIYDINNPRITNLTCNGKPVTDDMKFVLVCDIVTTNQPIISKFLPKQRIKRTDIHSTTILKNYIREQMEFGNITNKADNNWNVQFPSGKNYQIRSSSLSLEEAMKQDWYLTTLKTTEDYNYYQASFEKKEMEDTDGPTLVISSTLEEETHKNISIVIQATDASKVDTCKYMLGQYDALDPIWENGTTITNNSFVATSNGIYSVLAIDSVGNRTVKYINVSNINTNILQAPSVDKYTNRKTAISGTGEPYSTIHFLTETGVYSSQIGSSGTFSYKLPFQKANSKVQVYLSDYRGRKSSTVDVPVNRTGPNYPTVNNLDNTSLAVTGNLNDTTSQVFIVIGGKVYVTKNGGKALYKASSIYKSSKTIVETDFTTSGTEFTMTIPIQKANTTVKVYAIDKLSRTSSVTKLITTEVAPNQPVIYQACDAENRVYGYVPNPQNTYNIHVTINGNLYTGTTDINGYFTVETEPLTKDAVISVTASDMRYGVTRMSAAKTRTVSSAKSFVGKDKSTSIELSPMTNKDTVIEGRFSPASIQTLYLKAGNSLHKVVTNYDGSFRIQLANPLNADDTVDVVYRERYSNIKEVTRLTVSLALPETPELLTKTIYNTTEEVKVLAKDLCTAVVEINGKRYISNDGIYDESLGGYVYTIAIDKTPSNHTVSIFMENTSGTSMATTTSILPKAPEITNLSQVTTEDNKITGTVTLVLPERNNGSSLNFDFSTPQTPTVENTGTIVYVKVNEYGEEKLYNGVFFENNNFIVIFDNKLAEGTEIVVWAENAYGGSSEEITLTVTTP